MRQLLEWTAELVVVSLTAAIAAPPRVVTVCEALHDRLVLHQTDVFVVGRLTNTEEGSWLISKCDFAVVSGRYTWDQSIWVDPAPKGERAGLEWDKSALLARMPRGTVSGEVELSTECELPFAWAAVYGRFETRLNPTISVGATGQVSGVGFGHLGMSIARVLVPKSGLECLVTAEERSRAETSRRAKEQDHPLWVWRNLQSTLVGADGSEFFNRHVRGTMLPLLRGTITDIQQDGGVLTLLVSVFGSGSTDATLRVDEPLGTEFARGVEVEFEGVAKSFRAQPFCLTLDVAREKLRTSGPH